MKCSICGIQIDSVDEAIEEGWCPYFYDGETEHEVACPACTHALLQEGKDGELEVKEEYRGKLKYLDESEDEAWQDHPQVVIAVRERTWKTQLEFSLGVVIAGNRPIGIMARKGNDFQRRRSKPSIWVIVSGRFRCLAIDLWR